MPVVCSIDPANRVVMIRISGEMTGGEAAATLESVYQSPGWVAGYAIICDLTEVTGLMLGENDFPALVAMHRKYEAVAPRVEAMVARRQLDITMTGVYRIFMKPAKHKVHVCTSLEEAMALL